MAEYIPAYDLLLNTFPEDIENVCMIGKRYRQICTREDFWKEKLIRDYADTSLYDPTDVDIFGAKDTYFIYRRVTNWLLYEVNIN